MLYIYFRKVYPFYFKGQCARWLTAIKIYTKHDTFFILCIGPADKCPQIENLQDAVELNSGSEFNFSCIATGKPLPTKEEFKLIKQDGTILKVNHGFL